MESEQAVARALRADGQRPASQPVRHMVAQAREEGAPSDQPVARGVPLPAEQPIGSNHNNGIAMGFEHVSQACERVEMEMGKIRDLFGNAALGEMPAGPSLTQVAVEQPARSPIANQLHEVAWRLEKACEQLALFSDRCDI